MHNSIKQRGKQAWCGGAPKLVCGAPVDDRIIVVSEILLQADHELPDILQQTVVAGKLKISRQRAVN